jgi:hypothetical protein
VLQTWTQRSSLLHQGRRSVAHVRFNGKGLIADVALLLLQVHIDLVVGERTRGDGGSRRIVGRREGPVKGIAIDDEGGVVTVAMDGLVVNVEAIDRL